MSFLVDHPDRKPRPGVLRGGSAQVRGETPPQVDGDPRVEGPVAALQDVDHPSMHPHIIHFTWSHATRLETTGISVTCVPPGWVDGGMCTATCAGEVMA